MLVTLLTMLVAMNASAQTQNYYSEGFENWTSVLDPLIMVGQMMAILVC